MEPNRYDFGGYATRYGIRCTDGRSIAANAFKHCDGMKVPIVWQHDHDNPSNVVGQGVLEHRDNDGLYIYGKFNKTQRGKDSKLLVEDGTFTSLSLYANHVKQNGADVVHANPIEVSLVYSGANSGAYIDCIDVSHSEDSEGEAYIYGEEGFELDICHEDKEDKPMADETKKGKTVGEIMDTMNEEQKNLVYYLLAKVDAEGLGDDEDDKDDVKHSDADNNISEEEYDMKTNLFEGTTPGADVSHADEFFADVKDIMSDAISCGSFKKSVIAHAEAYGITDIGLLFPDAQLVKGIETVDRRQEWVKVFLNGAHKAPFHKIKSMYFDITKEEARALGYGTKGKRKIEEVILLFKRETGPTTVYKKQKFDQDDLIDADFNVIAYIRNEMRGKLDEEVARAGLIGDGRDVLDPNKIKEDCIRPVYTDDEIYSPKIAIGVSEADTASTRAEKLIDTIIASRKKYKGSGKPILWTTDDVLSSMLLLKDKTGHYIYKSETDLATTLRVASIQTVEVMESVKPRTTDDASYELAGIMLNPADYTYSAPNGGKVAAFEDFDIDFNQEKHLIETRTAGALTKPASALVFEFKSDSVSG